MNPDMKRELAKRSVPAKFGAFHGVCINRGMSGSDSRIHLDWLDDKDHHNLVIPFYYSEKKTGIHSFSYY